VAQQRRAQRLQRAAAPDRVKGGDRKPVEPAQPRPSSLFGPRLALAIGCPAGILGRSAPGAVKEVRKK
jgi:hypothetical protein